MVFALDLERLTRFHEEVLSLRPVERGPHHAVLEAPGHQVVLHAIPPEIASGLEVTRPPQRREEAAIKPFFPVASLAAARAVAASLGGVVDPSDREWAGGGFRACDGHDPEGNVIQLREVAS
ncbi:MAG: glyoxalase/bleomycin resistance/dioxygenase family protein [Anaeromyxobacter sp.]|nr:glyoxalase/bleomycin resistance/dioxygenase family protein [Anaeromyxobacter sp.]MBL0277215.1 glyoxalase/bleomycin resistance/dioxygenase family protein [Anaeromyxobacter sp.]